MREPTHVVAARRLIALTRHSEIADTLQVLLDERAELEAALRECLQYYVPEGDGFYARIRAALKEPSE